MTESGNLSTNTAVERTTTSQAPETRNEASAMAGRPPFDGFNPDSEDIESYLERLQEYFIAYDIKSETETAAKRRAILLTSIGSNVYRVLKDF